MKNTSFYLIKISDLDLFLFSGEVWEEDSLNLYSDVCDYGNVLLTMSPVLSSMHKSSYFRFR